MGADLRWLRGKVEESPLTAELDLNRLLVGLLHSLSQELKPEGGSVLESKTVKVAVEESGEKIIEKSHVQTPRQRKTGRPTPTITRSLAAPSKAASLRG